MAWETLSIPDVSTDIESQYFETDDAIEWSYVDITSLNSLLVFNSEVTIYTKDNFRLAIYTTSTPGATYEPYRPEYRIYYNNTLVASALCYDCDTVGLAIGYNTETQKAKLRSVQKRWAVYPPSPSDALYSSYRVTWDSSTQSDVYNALLNANLISEPITANGGGATHIAKVTGQLKDLSSNLSDILMVSGGGGGGLLVGDTDYSGKEAGGISGSGDNSADQSTGNAFGQGESGTNKSGGGSGLYGGYKGTSAKSGGAGSGYIGNSLLSNKKMVGYNIPTSSDENTKTESVSQASATPVSGKPKSGNGFARIKLIREVEQFRSISRPLGNRIMPAKFKPEYSYYYGRQEVPTGQQYYDIEGATPITLTRGGSDSFTFGDLPACFGIYDPNSSNVVNWYLRKTNSSGASMLINGSNTGSFSADGNYTFYIIAGGEPSNPNGKGYFTVIRTTDWSNGWGGLAFSTDVMTQLRDYFA